MRRDPLAFLSAELDSLRTQGLYRQLRVLAGEQKPTATTSLTWVRGNHTYKMGGEFTGDGYPTPSNWRVNGNFTFDGDLLAQYPKLTELYEVSPPLHYQPGDATVHHGYMVHGAPPNETDRHRLAYLNGIEKLNCAYCSYANGVVSYVREVAARTEQYWCPIRHARRIPAPHSRYQLFFDYGDAERYRAELSPLRNALRHVRPGGDRIHERRRWYHR